MPLSSAAGGLGKRQAAQDDPEEVSCSPSSKRAAAADSSGQPPTARRPAAVAAAEPARSEEAPPSPPPPPPPPPKIRLAKKPPRTFYPGQQLGSKQQQHMTPGQRFVQGWLDGFFIRVRKDSRGEAAGDGEPAVWERFPLQQPAFDVADELGLEVFSEEIASGGKRRFLVASRGEFWRRYSAMLAPHRHWYEIIRQGAPCHLYCDLEFRPADNPGLDGTAATDAVVALVSAQLLADFQLELQPGWVLELDSSTPAKFSRHLVIKIPGTAFASNAHVGAFVLKLCAAAEEKRREDAQAALLFVKKGEQEALFIDPAVYSRNRAFRLYLSSKLGKEAVLRATDRYGGAGLSQQEVFFACLVTDVEPGARLLRCCDESAEEAAAAAGSARRLRSSLPGVPRGAVPGSAGGAQVQYGPCPVPGLEAFINGVSGAEGGGRGEVRSWVALASDLLILNIRGSRYCGNVGREHKSNGVFYVADLQDGSWCQRCYDPDCRHYRSPLMPLPPHLLMRQQPCLQPAELEEEADEDSLMLQAVEQYERQVQAGPGQQQQRQGEQQQRQGEQHEGRQQAGRQQLGEQQQEQEQQGVQQEGQQEGEQRGQQAQQQQAGGQQQGEQQQEQGQQQEQEQQQADQQQQAPPGQAGQLQAQPGHGPPGKEEEEEEEEGAMLEALLRFEAGQRGVTPAQQAQQAAAATPAAASAAPAAAAQGAAPHLATGLGGRAAVPPHSAPAPMAQPLAASRAAPEPSRLGLRALFMSPPQGSLQGQQQATLYSKSAGLAAGQGRRQAPKEVWENFV